MADITRQYVKALEAPPSAGVYQRAVAIANYRYRTQQEVLEVARDYHRRKSAAVGDGHRLFPPGRIWAWCFDPVNWPDPEGMVDELREMGIALMVSVWPTVEAQPSLPADENRAGWSPIERGVQVNLDFMGNTTFFDATSLRARKFVTDTVKNYYDMGVSCSGWTKRGRDYHL